VSAFQFELRKEDLSSKARLGKITTTHSTIETPIFMPVGTRGAVKALTTEHVHRLGAPIILGNTYHLMLKPGSSVIEQAGGLHAFMGYEGSILTDSGGFQVFSLSSMNKITDRGVEFRSHIDGSKWFLGPQESMQRQKEIGADIVMAFDQCPPYPFSELELKASVERTHAWAKICRDYPLKSHQALFGINQGGVNRSLRIHSAQTLRDLDFPGYAIGGLSVGEPAELMYQTLDWTVPYLPREKPRYLMGVGTPRNIIEAVMRGVDMFDCVMPTRNARNGTAFTWSGKVSIKAGRYARDFSPLDPDTESEASRYSKAYLRHLLNVDEIAGLTLVTMQNVAFYLDLMKKIRQAIENDSLQELYKRICQIYPQ
jgi:queuine tRNA-ribosyltransferase